MTKSKYLWFLLKARYTARAYIRHIFLYFATSNISIMFYCPCQDLNSYESVLHKRRHSVYGGETLDILSCSLQRVTYLGNQDVCSSLKVQITPCWFTVDLWRIYPLNTNSQMEPGVDLISTNGIVCALQLHTAKALFNRLCFVRYNRYLCVYVPYFVKLYPYSLFIFSVLCA